VTAIILSNDLGRLEKILRNSPRPLDYLCLLEPLEDHSACEYLAQMPEVNELPLNRLARSKREEFREKYIEFMGQVNISNHSRRWWAMPFTNKYSLTGQLCRNLFHFQLIVEAQNSTSQTLVVLTGNQDLAEQVRRWGRNADIPVEEAIKERFDLKQAVRRSLPAGVAKAVLSSFLLWVLGRPLRPKRDTLSEHFLVATHTHTRSFSGDQTYRDAYFGPLVGDLAESDQKSIILGLPYEQPIQQLKEMKRLESGVPVVPVDSCMSILNLLNCASQAVIAFWRPPKLNGPAEFDGSDVTYLVKQAIKESTRSGDLFINLKMFYSARWMAQRIRLGRCLYPYENRAWEKMLILGVGAGSQQTRLVGYQHTSITPHHFNFFLAKDEAAITPLPGAIVTCGDVTRDWIGRDGNYPSGMFSSACALRQELAVNEDGGRKQGPIANLLVALGTGDDEYASAPGFLEDALTTGDRFQVRLRPHPSLASLALPQSPVYSISTGSLADDLKWADAILYTSSTVSLEAIALGIPAVYLDLGNFLSTDPLFGWTEFKWSVTEPSRLIENIETIESLPQNCFEDMQRRGRDYVYSYLKPVTPGNMRPFWEA